MMIKDRNNSKKGFVVIMVVLLLSVILIVGLGVFDIVLREILISNMGSESQKAFYAADSGAECVQYWQINGFFASGAPFAIKCNGRLINGEITSSPPFVNNPITSPIKINFTNGSCVEVRLTIEDPSLEFDTLIVARGYNIGCDDSSPKKVQRGVKITY
ncbi:hypothetical protein KKB71_00505 [Patescibacteria group bacterium]|nr:hypothetical protein [Patescibacteria group bacterium]MBU2219035.1 hypothetical protein [Patescibacteria group bacterium]MBU2263616.1 hypothetical protein [Patescibacteria group bacterium]